MTTVFISYRRSDSASSTGRIADRLQAHFGSDKVFYDVDTIPLGIDFRQYVSDRLDKTDVFLVVIGDEWLEAPKGSFLIVPGGTTHAFQNRGDERAGALNFGVPSGFETMMPRLVAWFAERPPGPA